MGLESFCQDPLKKSNVEHLFCPLLFAIIILVKSRRGYSLVELTVVLSIAAVILAVSVPVYTRYQANAQLKSQVDLVVSAIHQARASATQFADGVNYSDNPHPSQPASTYTVYAVKQGKLNGTLTQGTASLASVGMAVFTNGSSTQGFNPNGAIQTPVQPTTVALGATSVLQLTDSQQHMEILSFDGDGTLDASAFLNGSTTTVLTFQNAYQTYQIVIDRMHETVVQQ